MNLGPWDHLPPWMRGGMQDGGEGRGGMCGVSPNRSKAGYGGGTNCPEVG